jgi:predicted DNA-binding transcriptional regulator AlpA
MHDEYLNRQQLAKLLHCSVRTIHNYERSGTVPRPTVLGRRHLWLKSDLIAFIKAYQEAARSEVSEPDIVVRPQ